MMNSDDIRNGTVRYRERSTGVLKREGEFRASFPSTAFPALLTQQIIGEYGYDLYFFTPKPEHTDRQQCVEGEPVLTADGCYEQSWTVQDIEFSSEEEAEYQARKAAELIAAVHVAVQNLLDIKARERDYDGILSLCSYAASSHPRFGPEGRAGVVWRDNAWSTYYAIMDEVSEGLRPTPTVSEVLAEIPEFEWPEV